MLDITKPARTRDGRVVKDLCTVAGRIVGAIDGVLFSWNADGSHSRKGPHKLDIRNDWPVVWLNVYQGWGYGVPYRDRALADSCAGSWRLHLLEINLDTGETVKHNV